MNLRPVSTALALAAILWVLIGALAWWLTGSQTWMLAGLFLGAQCLLAAVLTERYRAG